MKKAEKGTSIGEAAMKLQGASKSDRQQVFKEIFDYLDGDGSGQIEVKEILDLLGKFEGILPPSYAQYIIDEVDQNRNGQIDFQEFMQVMGKTPEVSKSDIDELTSSFKFLANGKDKISRQQLVQAILTYTNKEDLDFDQDDMLDFQKAIALFYSTSYIKKD